MRLVIYGGWVSKEVSKKGGIEIEYTAEGGNDSFLSMFI